MTALILGLALAVGAAVALNGSYLLQHLGATGAPAISARRPIATMRGLLSSRLWAIGAAAGMLGWAMHVLALSQAPLSLVQAFVAGGLALTVPLSGRILGRKSTAAENRAVAAMALALALLAIGSGGAAATVFAPWGLVAFLAGAVAVAAIVAVLPLGSGRANALALGGGALYGAADVAIKALTSVAAHAGLVGVVTSPWLAAAALTTAGAFFCFQRALQSGGAISVIALMTAATNVVSIGGGFAVFHDSLGATPLLAVMHAAAFALALVAAWRLAAAQASLMVDPDPDVARGGAAPGVSRRLSGERPLTSSSPSHRPIIGRS